jgi:tetratricopeptide (TPR) repeat protein
MGDATVTDERDDLATLRRWLVAFLREPLERPTIDPPPNEAEIQATREVGDRILVAAERILGDGVLNGIAQGLEAQDARAEANVVGVARRLIQAREPLIAFADRALKDDRAADAAAAADLAIACTLGWGDDAVLGKAFLFRGRAARRRNDTIAGMDAMRQAAHLAMSEDPQLAAVALDELGMMLHSVGRLDDALATFDEALRLERDPAGRGTILHNRALVLNELGEHRQAALVFDEQVAAGRVPNAPPLSLAIALDSASAAWAALGERDRALNLLDEARELFAKHGNRTNRLNNALSRVNVLRALGDREGERAAFEAAYTIAMDSARAIEVEYYTNGFNVRLRAAMQEALVRLKEENGSEEAAFAEAARCEHLGAVRLQDGLDALNRADWGLANAALREAEALLLRAGRVDGALKARTNLAVVSMDSGRRAEAGPILLDCLSRARALGDARQELLSRANIENLKSEGVSLLTATSTLELLVDIKVLEEALPAIADGLRLAGAERHGFLWGLGATDDRLARICDSHGAYDLAEPHWNRAIAAARAMGDSPGSAFRLANRLANRLHGLVENDVPNARGAATEPLAVMETHTDNVRVQFVGHRALGRYMAKREPDAAIDHIRRTIEIQAAMRANVDPKDRAHVENQNPVDFELLGRLLLAGGDVPEAWTSFQGAKGRRVLDAVGVEAAPLHHAELSPLLERIHAESGMPAAVVDLMAGNGQLRAFVVTPQDVVVTEPVTPRSDEWINRLDVGDGREREHRAAAACLEAGHLRKLVELIEDNLPVDAAIFVVPDHPLQGLPLHIIPYDGRQWSERRPISQLPATGLIRRFARHPSGRRRVAFVGGDSDATLPAARRECVDVARLLGTAPHVGAGCSYEGLETALRGERLDVIHLAVHGRGDPRRGGRAALLLARQDGVDWVPFDDLLRLGLNAELVVLSGCSTAVAGPLEGQAAVSAAQGALEAGAGSVIACLWPVEDQVAATYMRALYERLAPAWTIGPTDIRRAMAVASERARAEVGSTQATTPRRDRRGSLPMPVDDAGFGSEVRDAVRWSPFVLYGDPVVGG